MKRVKITILIITIVCLVCNLLACSKPKNEGSASFIQRSSKSTISESIKSDSKANTSSEVSSNSSAEQISVSSAKQSSSEQVSASVSFSSSSADKSSVSNSSTSSFSSSSSSTSSINSSATVSIEYYQRETTVTKYRYVGYAFDYLKVDDEVCGFTATEINLVTSINATSSQAVTLIGWAGFNQQIEAFGYYFNDDINSATISSNFSSTAESAVIAAGGTNAKRFNISAQTQSLSNGANKVTFVAVLKDGVYILLYSVNVNISGKTEWDETNISDSEIVKAKKDEVDESKTFEILKQTSGYKTSSNLAFTTNGKEAYSSADKSFTISKGNKLTMSFASSESDLYTTFNKYEISYYSNQPLKATVNYTSAGNPVQDTVYFEAGKNLFSALALGYVDSQTSTNITSLSIEVLGASTAKFILDDISTEIVESITGGLKFIENQRFILGIKLTWGGGIAYLEDKDDNIAELANLINNYDTGRLVQQSYYGTCDESEYTPGIYGGNKWNYNPVQGGNLSGEPSRILDFEITARSIYVKAQPRDWAKTQLTPSYMENVYTVYSNRIQVDNRFIDFSGYEKAQARHQELPAFYTVGYLNSFVYYSGNSAWTNASLTTKNSLEFWGGNANAYFNLASAETWCAFVNENSGYGIGLFTPNAETLLAGRNLYDNDPQTMNPSSNSCSYVAPLRTIKMVSYQPLEYSFLITCGSANEIRQVFNSNKAFAVNTFE